MFWPVLAVLATGCMDFGFDPIDQDPPTERVVVVDDFVQAPLPATDLLFVVDDTSSMAQEQDSIAHDMAHLLDALAAERIAWQAGVVSTDMSASRAGWLRGIPWVLTPGTPGVEDLLADHLRVGTDGLPPEAGLAAAALALELSGPSGPNAGFRRPDALLHVIFVSDSDDESDDWLGDDPVGAFVDVLAAEEAWSGLPARASAVVGDLPSGCTSIHGTARPAERYHQVAEATDGVVESICSKDFSAILEALGEHTLVWPRRFELRAEPDPDSVRVSIDERRVGEGWVLELDPAAVVFDVSPPPAARIEVTYLVEEGA